MKCRPYNVYDYIDQLFVLELIDKEKFFVAQSDPNN